MVSRLWPGSLFSWEGYAPFHYTNWADGRPLLADVTQRLAMVGPGWDVNPPFPGQWVSRSPHCGLPGYSCLWAIVEFDTGPIIGPRVLRVPAQFPTIMAAIEEAHSGE